MIDQAKRAERGLPISLLEDVQIEHLFDNLIYRSIRDAKDAIAFQVIQIQHDQPLLDHVWFEKFVSDDAILSGIRKTAHHLMQETSFSCASAHLMLQMQQDRPTIWSLRILLKAIEADQQKLQQFEWVWENISVINAISSFQIPGSIKEIFIGIIQCIGECYVNRIILLEALYSHVSKAIDDESNKDYEVTVDSNSILDTAYHVSILARKVHQQDLDVYNSVLSEVYGNKLNLEVRSVSFTKDLSLAHEIARVLQEVILIANGDFPLPIYQAYLDDLASNDRHNPVFLGNAEGDLMGFKEVNTKDVGIIECIVETNEDIEYLNSIREFRLPIKSVIKINRIHKPRYSF